MPLTRKELLNINQKGWNTVYPIFYGGTALPRYGPLSATETDLNLIDDLTGQAALELGCGSGHTLQYLWQEKHAAELWGLDFCQEQLRCAGELLAKESIPAHLPLASMDENPGIPEAHFNLVVAIYALGWTPDLPRTLSLVHSYLKPGGKFVFSWEHPLYHCLEWNDASGQYIFERSYQVEQPEHIPNWNGVEIILQPRKISTYINALTAAGLTVERLIESELNPALIREQDNDPQKWYSAPRARLVPTTFIIKAGKPD